MRIEIELAGNKYAIEVDQNNFTAIAYRTNQDKESKNYGNQTENQLGFYSKLGNAAVRLIREEISTDDSTVSLSEFVAKYQALTDELKAQFDKLKL